MMWQSPRTWTVNLSDLFGPKAYASKRNEAMSVFVDKPLEDGTWGGVDTVGVATAMDVLEIERCVVVEII